MSQAALELHQSTGDFVSDAGLALVMMDGGNVCGGGCCCGLVAAGEDAPAAMGSGGLGRVL